ncbi:uncharacterized protein [Aristolochia californica]|uniref:uncharacterized protein n=1 Tax=Aristolochia californica TaxID=171875 RepID=UPI0035DBE038
MDNIPDREKICICIAAYTVILVLVHSYLNDCNSVTSEMFDRSNWTISKYFNKRPSRRTHSKILNSDIYYPYFKDCIGVIDGAHIKAHILFDQQARFWNRKGFLSQNVMAACTFDMQFTYILAGWEGSATDSRVLKSALTRRDKLYVPEGKYYLVDAGYTNLLGFSAPYRGTRYHLQEFGNNTPMDERELFNRRHSSLRNTIERTFGALKTRFKILKDAPPFDFDVQVNIVIDYCVLHNYICMEDHMDLFEDEEDDSSDESGGEHCEDNNESDIENNDSSDDVEVDMDTQRSTQKEFAIQSVRASYYRDVLVI